MARLSTTLLVAAQLWSGCGTEEKGGAETQEPERTTGPASLMGRCSTAGAADEEVGTLVPCSDPRAKSELLHPIDPDACPAVAWSSKVVQGSSYCIKPTDPSAKPPSLAGRCTTADPFGSSPGVLIPCRSARAESRLVALAPSTDPASGCRAKVGRTYGVHDFEDTLYCVEPTDPDARRPKPPAGQPAVGRCTDFNIDARIPDPLPEVVACSSRRARSRIVSVSRRGGLDCKHASLQTASVSFCLSRLRRK